MKQKRLGEIEQLKVKSVRQPRRELSLKTHERSTISKDAWRRDHPELAAAGAAVKKLNQTLRVQRKQTMRNPNKQGVFRLDMREVKEASDSGESPEALPPPPDEAVPSPEGSLDSERASLSDASRGVSFTKNDRDWFVERAAEQLSNAENISNLSKGYGKEQAGSVASSMGGICQDVKISEPTSATFPASHSLACFLETRHSGIGNYGKLFITNKHGYSELRGREEWQSPQPNAN